MSQHVAIYRRIVRHINSPASRFPYLGCNAMLCVMNVLILGSKGRLGSALVRRWRTFSQISQVVALTRAQIDLSDPVRVVKGLASQKIGEGDIVVNCAAATDVDGCERDPETARRINAEAPEHIARFCTAEGARLIHIGTDYVFDGSLERPYTEEDEAKPLSHYGVTKLEGDRAVLATSSLHAVVRVSWVFGPDKPSFIDAIVHRALTSPKAAAVHDKTSSPSYTEDLALWLEAFLAPSFAGGLYHLCNSGSCSWRDYGEYALECAQRHGIPVLTTTVAPLTLAAMTNFVALRPPHSSLDAGKFFRATGMKPRPWREAVEEYFSRKNL